MGPRRFRNRGRIDQQRIEHLIGENREAQGVASSSANCQTNHEQVMRTLYLTFDVVNHIPITHQHVTDHFERYYPYARVEEVQMQLRSPHALCAWVVLHGIEDMVEVLGEDLPLVMDVTVLNQGLWMRPQTCKCPLC